MFSTTASPLRYYRLDHKWLFAIGYFFYLVTPYVIGVSEFFRDYPGVALYQGFFKQIPAQKLKEYAVITAAWLPAFFFGHFVARLCWPTKRGLFKFAPTPVSLSVPYLAPMLFAVLLLFTFLARGSLFNAYATYDVAARGKMSTLLVVYNFFLVYNLLTRQKLSLWLAVGAICTALLLLSMGGRMYVTQTFLIYLMFKTSFAERPWRLTKLMVFALVGVGISAFIGVWRQGATFNWNYSLYSIFAEPLFTWFSTSTFLLNNEVPLLNFPVNFFTSFINLIPNTFVNVRQYVVAAQDMGYVYESPLGADSAWTTFVINFGSVGSCFFIALTGFALAALRHLSERNRFWAVYYLMVCSVLPFQFFRDGFYILNKQLFFNFIFIPALVLLIFKLLIHFQNRQPVPVGASPSQA